MPFSFLSLCASVLLAVAVTNAEYPAPGPCSGECSLSHDPSVIKRPDGKYFRFASGENVTVATATSLGGPWATIPGGVFPSATQLGAPDIHDVDSTYYLYFQSTAFGSNNASAIHVASSTSMEPGTWTDHGVLPLPIHNIKGSDPDYNLIDANLLTNANDTYFHLSFGSYFDGIYQIRLSSPLEIAPIPALTHLAQNETKRPDNLPLDPIEGSYQFKWDVPGHGWQHFLFFSSGTCCRGVLSVPQGEEYKVMVCRSASGPGPEGPYVDKNGRSCLEGGGTEILASHSGVFAPGGQGVYFDESVGVGGSVILYYHYLIPGTTKVLFGWNCLAFDQGGWPFLTDCSGGSTTSSQPPTHSTLPPPIYSSTASSSPSTSPPTTLSTLPCYSTYHAPSLSAPSPSGGCSPA